LGPITLFDKSALQSFNPDEALWFDNFYTTVICPLFFVETLADLSKEVDQGRTPEQVVGNIAYKTPEMGPSILVAHWKLRLANLLGYPVEMKGRPYVPGGLRTQLAGQSATVFELPPEMEAFKRWQRGDFLGVDREFAQRWRSELSGMDLTFAYPILRSLGVGKTKPRNLEEARQWAGQMVRGDGRRYTTIKVALHMLAIPPDLQP
jgi:hypothetical protein